MVGGEQAVYHKERCACSAVMTGRALLDCLGTFQSKVEEVTVHARTDALLWRSYNPNGAEEDKDGMPRDKGARTEREMIGMFRA